MGQACSLYSKLRNADYYIDGELPSHGEFVPLKIHTLYDGDTGTGSYLDENGNVVQITFRLFGIDTPEIKPSRKDISLSSYEEVDSEDIRLEKREALLSKSALERFIERASNGTGLISFESVKKVRKRKSSKFEGAKDREVEACQLDKYGRRLVVLHVLEDGKCVDIGGFECGSCNCRMSNFDNFPSSTRVRRLCCIKSRLCIPKRGISINRWMVDNGYALEYDGGTKVRSVGKKLRERRIG